MEKNIVYKTQRPKSLDILIKKYGHTDDIESNWIKDVLGTTNK